MCRLVTYIGDIPLHQPTRLYTVTRVLSLILRRSPARWSSELDMARDGTLLSAWHSEYSDTTRQIDRKGVRAVKFESVCRWS